MKNRSKNNNKNTLTNDILEYLNEQHHIFHLLFEIIIIILLVSVVDSIIIPSENIFYLLGILSIVSISVDYYLWNNLYQSLLFALILLGYLYYANNQKNFLKKFFHKMTLKKMEKNVTNEEDDNWSTLTNYSNDKNSFKDLKNQKNKIDTQINNNHINDKIYQEKIPNPNVLDFLPDDIDREENVIPYMKGIKEPNLESGLNGLPNVDYSDTPIGKMNNDILVALDDRHTIPLMQEEEVISNENIFRKGKYRNAIGTNLENLPNNVKISNKNWNLDRYYPKCKTINDEKTNNLKISNKMIHYCTNLPDIKKDQYKMISGDNVELIDPSTPHIQIFPKQFDIGGQGIVNKDFNAN